MTMHGKYSINMVNVDCIYKRKYLLIKHIFSPPKTLQVFSAHGYVLVMFRTFNGCHFCMEYFTVLIAI